jgi:hypothetical protein
VLAAASLALAVVAATRIVAPRSHGARPDA